MTPHDAAREALLPCPFCGAGQTLIHENLRPGVRMDGSGGEPVSVEVQHWCLKEHAMRSHIVMVGRDEASAVAAWNRRATAPDLARRDAEIGRLRAWLDFYRVWYQHALPGVAKSAEMALAGEPAPQHNGVIEKVNEEQGKHALGGIDGFLADLFGSDWRKQLERQAVHNALAKHMGI